MQTNIVGHTGADSFSRLARQAEFGGPVDHGKIYMLVDDFVGQGGTLANLRSHVILGGGRVIGATVLTGKSYSAHIALKAETLEALRSKHGKELEICWNERFGFALQRAEERYKMMEEGFELISGPSAIETIAVNLSVRERDKLKKLFGGRRWRKLKGVAKIRFPDENIYKAEVHWYEAHGIGRRKMKVKRILE